MEAKAVVWRSPPLFESFSACCLERSHCEDAAIIEEQDREEAEAPHPSSGPTPCAASEFRAALDTLFRMSSDTQPWFVFCVNPNDSQLLNQLEGRGVKG
jgi:myosin heavy subunit